MKKLLFSAVEEALDCSAVWLVGSVYTAGIVELSLESELEVTTTELLFVVVFSALVPSDGVDCVVVVDSSSVSRQDEALWQRT